MWLTRYEMYRSIERCLAANNLLPIRGRILGVSSIDNLKQIIRIESNNITIAEYPEVDMQRLPYDDESYDVVISDQVMEHLPNAFQAIDEAFRVLRKGGLGIHTTCLMNYVHQSPKDYWRFTPDALKYLFRHYSDILQCEAWGNRIAILLCLVSDRFRYMQIPDSRFDPRHWIATYNEQNYPIHTWIVARK